jgi:ABC-2 type transport system permease protein
MRHFSTIFWHEVRMLFLNPSTYIAAVLFLAFMGFIFMNILDGFTRTAQDVSPAVNFFRTFFLPVWVMVPLLTMKSLAEERRSGTLETLLTAPVSTTEVVLAKFGAAYLLYLMMWLSTLGFIAVLHHFAKDPRFLDLGPLAGGYIFVAVTGLLYVAVGTLASALARSQAVAAVLAFAGLFGLTLGLHLAGQLSFVQQESLHSLRDAVDSVDVFRHLEDFTRGVVDTRQIVFYLTGTALTLILSILGVEAKILRS